RMEFTDYFLLVAEIVGFARGRGIPTVGRGSGASSLVAYALGITNVDPLRYGLAFERFLHPARRDCPDLDIDLCWRRRDEVIAHVYQTYGADRVAMIATHATLGARSAFRETAKALGVANARVNALARRIPREMDLLGNRALSTIGECLSLARERGAAGVPRDADAIPEADAATAARLEAGDTLNCFQLESPAMRHLLRMLQARTLEDTIAAVALVRPGAAESGMKEAYCRRRRGLEPPA